MVGETSSFLCVRVLSVRTQMPQILYWSAMAHDTVTWDVVEGLESPFYIYDSGPPNSVTFTFQLHFSSWKYQVI